MRLSLGGRWGVPRIRKLHHSTSVRGMIRDSGRMILATGSKHGGRPLAI